MAVTYDWIVERMDAYPTHEGKEDVVFTVYWRVNGVEDGYTATRYGSVGVTYKAENPFTPYAELTKEKVIGWVHDVLNEQDSTVTKIELGIANEIEDKKNPKVVTPPLPWVA